MRDRVTVTLDQKLLKQVRAVAKRQRRPLSWVFEDMLAEGVKTDRLALAEARR